MQDSGERMSSGLPSGGRREALQPPGGVWPTRMRETRQERARRERMEALARHEMVIRAACAEELRRRRRAAMAVLSWALLALLAGAAVVACL